MVLLFCNIMITIILYDMTATCTPLPKRWRAKNKGGESFSENIICIRNVLKELIDLFNT